MTPKQKNELKSLRRQCTILKNQKEELQNREDFSNAINVNSLENLDTLSVFPNKRKKEEVIPITVLSDLHIEEEVSKTVVNGINEYNPKIAERRLSLYFKRLLYLLVQQKKAGYKFDTIVIGLLGDFITGYIHEELEENNLLTPAEATLLAQELLAKGIKYIADSNIASRIIIPCVVGNHGRTVSKKRVSSGYKNSYEYIMYHTLARLFKSAPGYEHVEFKIAESEFLYLNLFGKINMFSHGDHFRYQGGIGGIEVPLKKFVLRENIVSTQGLDMAWLAHWHQYILHNQVRVNGSVIGYSAYARSFGFAPEPPRMQFQLLDKKRGFTLNNPIYLTDY